MRSSNPNCMACCSHRSPSMVLCVPGFSQHPPLRVSLTSQRGLSLAWRIRVSLWSMRSTSPCVLGLVSPQYLKAEPKDSSSEKVALMRANPISGYCHYVTSVTKMCEARCVAGHGVSQGTLKGIMCGGTPFQDTANSVEKIYPKRLSQLKASSNSPGPLFIPSRPPSFRDMSLLGDSVNRDIGSPLTSPLTVMYLIGIVEANGETGGGDR